MMCVYMFMQGMLGACEGDDIRVHRCGADRGPCLADGLAVPLSCRSTTHLS